MWPKIYLTGHTRQITPQRELRGRPEEFEFLREIANAGEERPNAEILRTDPLMKIEIFFFWLLFLNFFDFVFYGPRRERKKTFLENRGSEMKDMGC